MESDRILNLRTGGLGRFDFQTTLVQVSMHECGTSEVLYRVAGMYLYLYVLLSY